MPQIFNENLVWCQYMGKMVPADALYWDGLIQRFEFTVELVRFYSQN